jgi:hypothetical protein
MIEKLDVVEAPKVDVPVVKISRLAILRKLLNEECGYTKGELAVKTGLKLTTVNCQLYYHLPAKDFKIEKLAEKKVRFERETI